MIRSSKARPSVHEPPYFVSLSLWEKLSERVTMPLMSYRNDLFASPESTNPNWFIFWLTLMRIYKYLQKVREAFSCSCLNFNVLRTMVSGDWMNPPLQDSLSAIWHLWAFLASFLLSVYAHCRAIWFAIINGMEALITTIRSVRVRFYCSSEWP